MVVEGVPGRPWESGEACRIEVGASLPPRKRLLAGLKQNGWFSSSTASASSSSFCSWQDSTTASHLSTELKKREESAVEAANLPDNVQQGGEDGKELRIIAGAKENFDEVKDLDHERHAKSFTPTSNCRDTRNWQPETMANGSRCDVKAASSSSSDSGIRSCRLKRKAANNEVEAAKLTAVKAAKIAAEARATAAAKAEAAAKAAAVAKAALDAAAVVARKAASNSQRPSAKAASRTVKKKKKTNRKRARTDSGISQIPPPLNDEEFARQLHRVMNSSPRILRSTSFQGKGVPVASTERIKDSVSSSMAGRKNQHVQPKMLPSIKDGKKQGVVKKSPRLPESGVKLESQSTDESSKSMQIDATAVTSIHNSGSSFRELEGATAIYDQQAEDVDTSVNGSFVRFASREEKFNRDDDVNLGCDLGSPKLSESACDDLDVSAGGAVDIPKKLDDLKVTKLGEGQDKIATDKGIDEDLSLKVDETSIVGVRDVPYHISVEDQKKEAGMLTNELGRLPETVPSAAGKRAKQQSDRESCKERDIDDLLKFTRTAVQDGKKEADYMNNSSTGSGIEGWDNWYMNTELKQHDEIKCSSSKGDNRALVKQRSLNTRSKSLSKGQSCVERAQVGAQFYPKSKVKGVSSVILDSFTGERNIAPFGSPSTVPVRACAFANGPIPRNT